MADSGLEKLRNVEIFNDMTFQDLLSEIYERTGKTQDKINRLLKELSPLIENVSNATLIAPIIGDYLDISVKNDEQLIKLAAVIQKHIKDNTAKIESDDGLLPKEEIEEIRKAVQQREGKIVNMG